MSFYKTVSDAIEDIQKYGYDSQQRIDRWIEAIKQAAKASLTPPDVLQAELQRTMAAIYQRMIEQGGILKTHKGVSRWTLDRLKPRLRNELDRRVMASAQLIRLNRSAMIEKTSQRFTGWASSVPAGGADMLNKVATKNHMKKALQDLPFEERRVMIDQGHKFVSELNNIVAVDSGALAAVWHSHWRQAGYNYRPDHKERDQNFYVIPNNWALEKGLMKLDGEQYTNDITKPAEEPFCRCQYQYVYNLRDLPERMLTVKGKTELERVRSANK